MWVQAFRSQVLAADMLYSGQSLPFITQTWQWPGLNIAWMKTGTGL